MEIKKLLKLLLVLAPFIFITGCKPIKHYVNRAYKPLSIADQQEISLNNNLKNVTSIEPEIGVRIGERLLSEFLPQEINKEVLGQNEDEYEIKEFQSLLKLTKQALIVDANFVIISKEIQAEISGKLEGYISVSSVKDTVFFLPAFKRIKVKKIDFINKKPGLKNRAIAMLIKPVVKHFLDNVNGWLLKKQPKVHFNWFKTLDINTSKLLSNGESTITGPTVNISRGIKGTALLIEDTGISIIIDLKKSKAETISLKGDSLKTYKNFNEGYKKYSKLYAESWVSKFKPYDETTQLSAGIAKSTLAGIINDVLMNGTLNVDHTIKIPKQNETSDLELDRIKVDCDKVREKFSFPDFKYGKSCNYSCMKKIKIRIGPIKITKRIDDPVCGAARAACKLARESARIKWQVAREHARIAHQIYNEGKVAACKLVVEASELVDLGKLKSSSEGEGKAYLNLQNIVMNENLSSMNFKIKGAVNLNLKSYIGLRPQDIGHVFMCTVNYDKNINTKLKGTILNQFSEINFTQTKSGENIILTGKVAPIAYEAKADMSPLHELFIDPLFITKCAPLYATLATAGAIGGAAAMLGFVEEPELQLLLKGSAVGTYELDPFKQEIEPIIFRINNGVNRKAQVSWGINSIDYTYK